MDSIDRLLAIEEIKSLKARYFRCVDTKDWKAFEAVFTADASFDVSEDLPGCILIGRSRIAKFVSASLADCLTIHHGHCPEIEITSDTTARGIWAMEDLLRWSATSPSRPNQSLHGYGHYIETYAKDGDRWLISTLALRRLRIDQ
jgi:hypothetical protein